MANSVLIFPVGWRALDSNGDTVSGAQVKFYNSGTTTPKEVYSDSGLTSSLGTTVYCDAGGYPVEASGGTTKVEVYTGNASYKVEILDADGATVVDARDNVKGFVDPSSFLLNPTTETTIDADDFLFFRDISDTSQSADGTIKDITRADAFWGVGSSPSTTLASAATVNIGAAKTPRIAITGTTTIGAFDAVANECRLITFFGALTLTHSTALQCPGATDLSVVAGDSIIAYSDGAGNWKVAFTSSAAAASSTVVTMTVFTASGTYTKPAGLKHALVIAQGGGGGGGGGDGDAGTGGYGGGGGGGCCVEALIDAASLGAATTVTMGAGGAGAAAGSGTGSTGGATSLGAHLTASGGVGGTGMANGTSAAMAAGGGGGNGSIATGTGYIARGATGDVGMRFPSSNYGVSGKGADSRFGGGGTAANVTNGGAGVGYGSGGGGGGAFNAVDRAGGNGADGILYVFSFF